LDPVRAIRHKELEKPKRPVASVTTVHQAYVPDHIDDPQERLRTKAKQTYQEPELGPLIEQDEPKSGAQTPRGK